MGLPSREDLRLFHREARNTRFSYTDLEEFIREHIGESVLSRAEIAEYLEEGKAFSVTGTPFVVSLRA